jgi:hypothetical protein
MASLYPAQENNEQGQGQGQHLSCENQTEYHFTINTGKQALPLITFALCTEHYEKDFSFP